MNTKNPERVIGQCDKCHGTGEYRFISKRNGKPSSGLCYQCAGKGIMTVADDRRTASYWIRRACNGD